VDVPGEPTWVNDDMAMVVAMRRELPLEELVAGAISLAAFTADCAEGMEYLQEKWTIRHSDTVWDKRHFKPPAKSKTVPVPE
jgi:hypothetical protein